MSTVHAHIIFFRIWKRIGKFAVRILTATDLRHSSRAFLVIEGLKGHKLLTDMLKLVENIMCNIKPLLILGVFKKS